MVKGVFLAANNASSPQRLVDVAKVVYNFERSDIIEALIITKPVGSAAQVGVPEVSKLAYKLGRRLVVLPSINDALELLRPTKVFLVCRTEESQPLEVAEVVSGSLFVISCSDVGFTKNELALGMHVYPKHFNSGIGPAAEAALTLHALASKAVLEASNHQ